MNTKRDMALIDTGERILPERRNKETIEHLHRYALAMKLCANKDVLDIASGEGYGSYLITSVAHTVLGVDIFEEAVEHARKKYIRPNLTFKTGSATAIPVADCSIDIVVSFETLEHVDSHDKMLSEIKRVLRPGGLLFISTPDAEVFSGVLGHRNPFHISELTRDNFEILLKAHFANVHMLQQKFVSGSLIFGKTSQQPRDFNVYQGSSYEIQEAVDLNEALYYVALASSFDLPCIADSFFDGEDVHKQHYDLARSEVSAAMAQHDALANSFSYRIGRLITLPARKLLQLRRNKIAK